MSNSYTQPMRCLRTALAFLACLGLLAVQLSGLHMHLNAHGYAGVPVGTHVHHIDGHHHDAGVAFGHIDDEQHRQLRGPSDHDGDTNGDHDGDQDISVVQLAGGVGKLILLFVCMLLGLVVTRDAGTRVAFPRFSFVRARRLLRWRPPLRAPPVFSP